MSSNCNTYRSFLNWKRREKNRHFLISRSHSDVASNRVPRTLWMDGRTGDADGVTDSKYNTRRRPTAEHYSLHGPRFLESLMQNCFTVERSLFYSCTNKDHYSLGACSSSGLKGDKYRHNSLEFPYYNDFAKRSLHI